MRLRVVRHRLVGRHQPRRSPTGVSASAGYNLGCHARIEQPLFLCSSRRRHTIWTGDWSSDVCSSDLPERLLGQTIPVAGGVDMTFHEPLGVVGLITPWNFPLVIASWKVAPALAAGNTVVLKPAELTPLTSLQLERIALEAGLPEGVLNVVAGPGSEVGRRLVEHPDVAKIAFTGSTEVGRGIAEGAAGTIKRVTLELGGKSANVIFADADLDAAAEAAPLSVFGNAGQDCCARSRILVERSAMDRFMEVLEEAVESIRVGDPLDESTEMGPLISADQRETVSSFVPD